MVMTSIALNASSDSVSSSSCITCTPYIIIDGLSTDDTVLLAEILNDNGCACIDTVFVTTYKIDPESLRTVMMTMGSSVNLYVMTRVPISMESSRISSISKLELDAGYSTSNLEGYLVAHVLDSMMNVLSIGDGDEFHDAYQLYLLDIPRVDIINNELTYGKCDISISTVYTYAVDGTNVTMVSKTTRNTCKSSNDNMKDDEHVNDQMTVILVTFGTSIGLFSIVLVILCVLHYRKQRKAMDVVNSLKGELAKLRSLSLTKSSMELDIESPLARTVGLLREMQARLGDKDKLMLNRAIDMLSDVENVNRSNWRQQIHKVDNETASWLLKEYATNAEQEATTSSSTHSGRRESARSFALHLPSAGARSSVSIGQYKSVHGNSPRISPKNSPRVSPHPSRPNSAAAGPSLMTPGSLTATAEASMNASDYRILSMLSKLQVRGFYHEEDHYRHHRDSVVNVSSDDMLGTCHVPIPCLSDANRVVIDTMLNNDLYSNSFDMFTFHELTGHHALYYLSRHIITNNKYIVTLGLDEDALDQYLLTIEAGYHNENEYHNSIHAAEVVLLCWQMMAGLARKSNAIDLMDSVCDSS